ncbi:unnamed protein product, partial [marine sediment metagenome]
LSISLGLAEVQMGGKQLLRLFTTYPFSPKWSALNCQKLTQNPHFYVGRGVLKHVSRRR